MARPKLSDVERRSVQINARFTALQAAEIEHKAATAGISPTDYVYRSAIGSPISIPARRNADPHLITKLDQLGNQVRALGNVVNQVATYCHVQRDIPHDMPQLVEDIRRLRDEIDQALCSVVGE